MVIEQTVEVPVNRRIFIDIPPEIPTGKIILTFTTISTASKNKELECAEKIWAYNRAHPKEITTKLQELKGSLEKNAFDGLDGVAYQQKARGEWNE